jgi:hypothetical protein
MAFDESHHISEFKDPEGMYNAGDVFKIVAKQERTGVICCGLPHMMEIVDANQQVQETKRSQHTVEPLPLDLSPGSDLKSFMTALNGQLPFDTPSCLDEDDVVLRIALLCACFTGRIAKFFHQVTAYAISIGAHCIDVTVLTTFLRERKEVDDQANIFLMSREAADAYPEIVEKARRDRIVQAENRRSNQAAQKRVKVAFGARN